MSLRQRLEIITKHRCCWSCLVPGHKASTCWYKKRCEVSECQRVHSPLLHEAHMLGIKFGSMSWMSLMTCSFSSEAPVFRSRNSTWFTCVRILVWCTTRWRYTNCHGCNTYLLRGNWYFLDLYGGIVSEAFLYILSDRSFICVFQICLVELFIYLYYSVVYLFYFRFETIVVATIQLGFIFVIPSVTFQTINNMDVGLLFN